MSYQHALTGLTGDQNSLQANRQIDYYVDGALGDDTNLGTMESPFKTIQAAINASDESNNAGHNNIYINSGRYVEALQINDDDLLTLNGMGDNAWDVTIGTAAPFQPMGAINITGGSNVEITNLQTSGGYNGIYATGLDLLTIDGVYSNHNTLNGMYFENVGTVDISNTRVFQNVQTGIFGSEIGSFTAQASFINDNQRHGIRLLDSGEVRSLDNRVLRNGVDAMFVLWRGIIVETADVVEVVDGFYSYNQDDGIYLNSVADSRFENIKVNGNGERGVQLVFAGKTMVNGGSFTNNRSLGFAAQGFQSTSEYAKIQGAYFAGNGGGVSCSRFMMISFEQLDVRNNGAGASAWGADNFLVQDGAFVGNTGSGLLFDTCENAEINNVISRNNGQNGLHIRNNTDSATINGGLFFDNEYWGIRAHGTSNKYNGQLFINDANVSGNSEGFKAEYYDHVTISGGYYSQNTAHGLHFFDFNNAELNNVYSIGNGGSGAHFNLGQYFADDEMANYNNVTINGGFYNKNGHHGVIATTRFDRSEEYLDFTFTATNLAASQNLRNGLALLNERNLGAGFENEAPEGLSTVTVDGGQFNLNGEAGASIFVNADAFYYQQVNAYVNNVRAINNGDSGLEIGSIFLSDPMFTTHQPVNDAWFTVMNSNLNGNGHDGLRLRFLGEVGQHSVQNLASVDNVTAINNSYSGMDIESGLLDEDLSAASVSVVGGRFSRNQRYGINATNQDDVLGTPNRFNTPNFTFTDVIARTNQMTGVSVYGPDVDNMSLMPPTVTFTGGEIVGNSTFGIDVYNLTSLVVDGTYVAYNGSIGIHGRYVQMADVASAIATGNGEQDIKISSGAG